ncbi:coiled-coil domain-containing protein 66 isoform X2 [Osmerus mordax]|uniref:coiled-coil domain-containing protein 66 isoform X2 n=1 Tax=Osmerus mordax TaxID=8014 RepID=UPI0035100D1C
MNLGDGLMFELENGKPRLKLINNGSKNPNTILSKHRPQNALNSKHQVSKEPGSEDLSKVQGKQRDRETRIKTTAPKTEVTKSDVSLAAPNPSKQRGRDVAENRTKGVSRVQPSDRRGPSIRLGSTDAEKDLAKDTVCLTSDQITQILSTISKASPGSTQQWNTHSQTRSGFAQSSQEVPLNDSTKTVDHRETLNVKSNAGAQNGIAQKTQEDKRVTNGLFTSLGETEKDKEAVEAQKAQWRRELDEQMAMKVHQRKTPEVADEGVRRTGDMDVLWPAQRDLPAAIRSAFVLGEATPTDHAFIVQKRALQRAWLQDLDQQRQDDKLRHKQEKQLLNQRENNEHWASHFDSLQMKPPPQPRPPPAAERGEWGALSSLSQPRTLSGALSMAWEASSTCGASSTGRASVDAAGVPPRASHLRTMTALLDPAQIEERERNRIKQQEHQRAIEAQVEERRWKREQEEAARVALEQEEERRVELERQQLQQQYLQDTRRHRQKEELLERQTEQLHQSVQRAQEEAAKDKQQQRIKELARKGHDVSNLLRSLEGPPTASQTLPTRESPSPRQQEPAGRREEAVSTASPRRDTAMQTVDSVWPAPAPPQQEHGVYTPDIPVEYRPPTLAPPPPNAKRSRRDPRQAQPRQGAGKENVHRGGGGEGGEDPYEAFARTDVGLQGARGGGRRPEWNSQRPGRRFVPASERYPAGLQQSRQEKRLRRQIELMTLVERNTASRTPQPDQNHQAPLLHPPLPRQASPTQGRTRAGSPRKGERSVSSMSNLPANHNERGRSPPVPALKHRLQTQGPPLETHSPPLETHSPPLETNSPLPPSEFVPYVRTDEVYHLDPLAPLSRPPTVCHPQAKAHTDGPRSTAGPPGVPRDPLLNPELLKNRERQQAILRGLSELRQGLLQKQRALETGFNPLFRVNEQRKQPPPLEHM